MHVYYITAWHVAMVVTNQDLYGVSERIMALENESTHSEIGLFGHASGMISNWNGIHLWISIPANKLGFIYQKNKKNVHLFNELILFKPWPTYIDLSF